MPFVYGELIQVLHSLYSRFIKLKIIEEANTTFKLLKLVPKDSKIWCDPSKVDIGVGANKYIKKGVIKKEISEMQRNLFRKIALNFRQAWCLS